MLVKQKDDQRIAKLSWQETLDYFRTVILEPKLIKNAPTNNVAAIYKINMFWFLLLCWCKNSDYFYFDVKAILFFYQKNSC